MKVQSVSLAGVELGGGHKGRKEAICFGVPASVSIWHRSVNHPPCRTDQCGVGLRPPGLCTSVPLSTNL